MSITETLIMALPPLADLELEGEQIPTEQKDVEVADPFRFNFEIAWEVAHKGQQWLGLELNSFVIIIIYNKFWSNELKIADINL